MRITESRLRATIRHQVRRSLNESPAEVAEVYADALYRGENFHEMVQDFAKELDDAVIKDFAATPRNAASLKAFEDALAQTGEFDVSARDAWQQAWRVANFLADPNQFMESRRRGLTLEGLGEDTWTLNTPCPECGGTEAHKGAGDTYTCAECGTDVTPDDVDDESVSGLGTCPQCGSELEVDYSRSGRMGGSYPDYVCPNCG